MTSPDPAIADGSTDQFTATGNYSDGSTRNLTTQVAWASSNTRVATINSSGLADGISSGTTTIQAALTGITGSMTLTVTQPGATLQSIAITAQSLSIGVGSTDQFTATGSYSDGSTANITTAVQWSSSRTSVATITTSGSAAAISAGTTTIRAALNQISGTATLTVAAQAATLQSIAVTPQNISISVGGQQQFTATGTYSDNSTANIGSSVQWSSSNPAAATINSAGLASGVAAGATQISASSNGVTGSTNLNVASAGAGGTSFAGVLTQHNDNQRTGQNLSETQLTLANVNVNTFGKLFSAPVDGYVYAQPLYVASLIIAGGTHNVVYVATEADSLFAFDADDGSLLWQSSLIDGAHGATAGETPGDVLDDLGCGDMVPQVGITGTPVIDSNSGILYADAVSKKSDGSYVHRLHMIDITTGAEEPAGPAVISATVAGNSDGGTTDTFNPLFQLNRPGLLLVNGHVWVGYGSYCDNTPYHGWLFAYDATSLTQTAVFITTPNGQGQGGIWMSGTGLAADANGNLFVPTGNGNFDSTDFGDSVLKLSLSSNTISLVDYFTPFDQANDDANDWDIGSGGLVLLPDQPGPNTHELVVGGKSGSLYLVNRDQMTANDEHYCSGCSSDPQIIQENTNAGTPVWLLAGPAYWNETIYVCGIGDPLQAYSLTNGLMSGATASQSSNAFGSRGTTPSISANGTSNGIVWAIDAGPSSAPRSPATVYAFDATNLANELWDSSQAASNRDTPGNAVKFAVPTIFNGKVYVGTQTELDVYGLF